MEKNNQIITNGIHHSATKLSVLTIGLGLASKLGEVEGVIKHTPDGVKITTKEAPNGFIYDDDREAVVRIIGGRVLINGLYDIYCPPSNKLAKLLSNPINLELTDEQSRDLAPLLEAASEVKPSLAPSESGRVVVVITKELIAKIGADGSDENGEYIYCRDEWDTNPDSTLTKLYADDTFIITDEKNYTGYRIGSEEFCGTHRLDGIIHMVAN